MLLGSSMNDPSVALIAFVEVNVKDSVLNNQTFFSNNLNF